MVRENGKVWEFGYLYVEYIMLGKVYVYHRTWFMDTTGPKLWHQSRALEPNKLENREQPSSPLKGAPKILVISLIYYVYSVSKLIVDISRNMGSSDGIMASYRHSAPIASCCSMNVYRELHLRECSWKKNGKGYLQKHWSCRLVKTATVQWAYEFPMIVRGLIDLFRRHNHRAHYSFRYPLHRRTPDWEEVLSLGGIRDIRNTKFNDENPSNANQALLLHLNTRPWDLLTAFVPPTRFFFHRLLFISGIGCHRDKCVSWHIWKQHGRCFGCHQEYHNTRVSGSEKQEKVAELWKVKCWWVVSTLQGQELSIHINTLEILDK